MTQKSFFFKAMNSIIKGTLIPREEFDEKQYSNFRMNVWLSMCPEYLNILRVTNNKDFSKDKYTHYLFLFYTIPKSNKFIRYIGQEKGSISKEDIAKIAEYLKYSKFRAKLILKYLSKEAIEFILGLEYLKG